MAEPATSMDIPAEAVTYRMDDPSHAIEAGARYGIKMLSPDEAKQALPHFGGQGVARPTEVGGATWLPWLVLSVPTRRPALSTFIPWGEVTPSAALTGKPSRPVGQSDAECGEK